MITICFCVFGGGERCKLSQKKKKRKKSTVTGLWLWNRVKGAQGRSLVAQKNNHVWPLSPLKTRPNIATRTFSETYVRKPTACPNVWSHLHYEKRTRTIVTVGFLGCWGRVDWVCAIKKPSPNPIRAPLTSRQRIGSPAFQSMSEQKLVHIIFPRHSITAE